MHDSIYSKSLDQNTSVHNKLYKDNKKAIDDDENYIAEQDKIETSEATETPAN